VDEAACKDQRNWIDTGLVNSQNGIAQKGLENRFNDKAAQKRVNHAVSLGADNSETDFLYHIIKEVRPCWDGVRSLGAESKELRKLHKHLH
jgi:hypothetical protein